MTMLKLTSGESVFEIEFGTEILTKGARVALHAGGDQYLTASAVYEADKGFIILDATPLVISSWGEQGYTTSLTARDSNFEKTEKIFSVFESLYEKASNSGQDKNSNMVNWIRKQILDYYFKQTSTNARFQVDVHCKSHTIRGPEVWPFGPGAVIDTKTANLEIEFSFRLIKLVTPEEINLLEAFLSNAIDSGNLVNFNFK